VALDAGDRVTPMRGLDTFLIALAIMVFAAVGATLVHDNLHNSFGFGAGIFRAGRRVHAVPHIFLARLAAPPRRAGAGARAAAIAGGTMSGTDFDSLTQTENRLAQIEKQLARIEGKLNFGLSIIIALSLLNLIKIYWPA
jgi:hypothetical protein